MIARPPIPVNIDLDLQTIDLPYVQDNIPRFQVADFCATTW